MLRIKKELWEKVIHHLMEGLPNEACGIMGGNDGKVTEIYPIKNVDENPKVRYLIDPRGQFNAFKDMRKKGMQMLAIFHSHPESPAIPSVTDIGLAFYPEAYYIIISLKDRKNPDAHSYKINHSSFIEHPIIIE